MKVPKLVWTREATLSLMLILLLGAASVLEPKFVTLKAQTLLSTHLWELAIVSVPMLLIIITGGIDLSIGAIIALTSVVFGLLFEKGVSPWIAAPIALVVATTLGAINGWFVAKLRVHPLLVTLASMAAFRGIAEGISMARPLSGYPEAFLTLSRGFTPVAIFAILALAAHVILTRTHAGRHIIAIGTDENVSRFSKTPITKIKLMLYAFSGFACGLATLILVARNNTAKADLGMGIELDAITAVVLGGASIHGGKGRIPGLILGLLLIHETREFVSWHFKQNELNLLVIGTLLIATVLLENISTQVKTWRQARLKAQ